MASPVIDWSRIDAASSAPTRQELAVESLSCLGAEMCLNGLPVPAITAGHLVLLSAMDSPVLSGGDAGPRDVYAAMVVLHGGREAVSSVQELLAGGDMYGVAAMELVVAEAGVDTDILCTYIRSQIRAACAGFETLPAAEPGEEKPFAFDAEWLAYYVSRLCPATNMDMDRVVWSLPLIMGGFVIAQLALAAGVKGVQRKSDDKAALDEITRQMEGAGQ